MCDRVEWRYQGGMRKIKRQRHCHELSKPTYIFNYVTTNAGSSTLFNFFTKGAGDAMGLSMNNDGFDSKLGQTGNVIQYNTFRQKIIEINCQEVDTFPFTHVRQT